MRILAALGVCVIALSALAGCSKGADETPLKAPQSVNNNDARASTAGAAPDITNTPTPGAVMKGKMRGGATAGAPAPPNTAPTNN